MCAGVNADAKPIDQFPTEPPRNEREKDAGKGEQHVAQSHDGAVPPSFEVAGDQPEDGADEGADGHRDEARQKGTAP